jgi:hypothetical protein
MIEQNIDNDRAVEVDKANAFFAAVENEDSSARSSISSGTNLGTVHSQSPDVQQRPSFKNWFVTLDFHNSKFEI